MTPDATLGATVVEETARAAAAPAAPGAARAALGLVRRPATLASLVTIVAIVGMAVIGPVLIDGDPYKANVLTRLVPPGERFLLGSDELGRSQLVRIVHGARMTLLAGLAAVMIGTVAGTLVGLAAGFWGRWVDTTLMIVVDVLLSFPYFLLVVLIVAVLGPSLTTAMIAIGVWTAPYYARQIRAATLELRHRPFVEAARVVGERDLAVIGLYILPNCLPQLLVLSTLYMSQAILLASALSFLGLGAQPPAPEWGAMTAVGREYMFTAPHVLYVPAFFIFLTALAFNFLGDALREALDPRMRSL